MKIIFSFIFTILSFVMFTALAANAQETSGGFSGGSILLGYDTRTCNAGLDGSMRYDSSTSTMEYCDGTAWADIAPAAGASGVEEICRFLGPINGNSGPDCANSSPTWKECGLYSCELLRDASATAHSCITSGTYPKAYYTLQEDCSDGVCDADYYIWRGVFNCVDW